MISELESGIFFLNILLIIKYVKKKEAEIPAKKRRLGKSQGFKKSYTKAIVTIKKGQKIEII